MKNLAGITRRQFLRGAIAGGSAIGLSRRAKAQGEQKTGGRKLATATTRRELLSWWAKQNPLTKTIVETPFVEIGAIIASEASRHPKLKHVLEEMITRGYADKTDLANILALSPVWEEIAYRALPSGIIDAAMKNAKGKSFWAIGIPVSAIFAMAHYRNYYPKALRKTYVTIGEFILGCYYWRTMRKRGLASAIAAHSEANMLGYFIIKSSAKK